MNSASAVLDMVVGGMLSLLFYGGLWLTVQELPVTRHPVALTLGSYLFRTAVVVCGVLFVSRGRWQNALVCLVGFAIGRIAVSRLVLRCT